MTDEQLMEAVRDGEVGRLGELFERHGRLFYGYFVRLTGDPDASNLASDHHRQGEEVRRGRESGERI